MTNDEAQGDAGRGGRQRPSPVLASPQHEDTHGTGAVLPADRALWRLHDLVHARAVRAALREQLIRRDGVHLTEAGNAYFAATLADLVVAALPDPRPGAAGEAEALAAGFLAAQRIANPATPLAASGSRAWAQAHLARLRTVPAGLQELCGPPL